MQLSISENAPGNEIDHKTNKNNILLWPGHQQQNVNVQVWEIVCPSSE